MDGTRVMLVAYTKKNISKFMKIEQSKNENTICQLLHHSILMFFSFLGSNTQKILAAVESG
jgi:hypothetical protein